MEGEAKWIPQAIIDNFRAIGSKITIVKGVVSICFSGQRMDAEDFTGHTVQV